MFRKRNLVNKKYRKTTNHNFEYAVDEIRDFLKNEWHNENGCEMREMEWPDNPRDLRSNYVYCQKLVSKFLLYKNL